jgi:hypothetical protein
MMIVLGVLQTARCAPRSRHCDSLRCQSGSRFFPE